MPTLPTRSLRILLVAALSCSAILQAQPNVNATKADEYTANGAGKVLPGAPITYRTVIGNTGSANATSVNLADSIPTGTTLVPNSVNVSPLAFDDSYSTIVNTQLAVGSPTLLTGPLVTNTAKTTDNDTEFLSDSFTISAYDSTSAQGGAVVMTTSGPNMGSFTYLPAAGFVGTDTFTYTIRDDGTDSTAGNADDLTGSGTVTITVTEANTSLAGTQKVWYVDNSYAGANGAENGTSARPFNALSDVSDATGPDAITDTIFLSAGVGAYTGGITLLADQSLIGENQALTLNSITLKPAGIDPTLSNAAGNGVTLATGNTLQGFTIGDTSGGDIVGTAVGALTVSNVNCNGTGPIMTVSTSGTLNVTLDTATTTSSITTGISLTGCSGSFAATSGSISGVTNTEINLSGGSTNFTYPGTISSTGSGSISIASRTGGTVTLSGNLNITGGTGISCSSNTGGTINFTGTTKTINTGASTAVNLASNTGATINFTGGGLDIDTTSAAAFTATGGGTVSVQGSVNTIAATSGSGLIVTATTIGSSGLTFQSINSGAGANTGISLDTTGSSGGLTVVGTGSAGSGGTISGKTGANGSTSSGIGIYLNNTSSVSLDRMTLQNFENFGIRGFNVSGFSLLNSTVNTTSGFNGNDDASNEGSVVFGDQLNTSLGGLSGTVNITNSVIANGFENNFVVSNHTGTMTFTMSNSTVRDTQTVSPGNEGLAFYAESSSNMTIDIVNSSFLRNRANGIHVINQSTGTVNFDLGSPGVASSGGTFTDNTLGVNINGNNSGATNFNLLNATFTVPNFPTLYSAGGASSQININLGGAAVIAERGAMTGNIIGNSVNMNSSLTGPGVRIIANGTDNTGGNVITFKLDSNTIIAGENRGIDVLTRDGNAGIQATITNNTVSTTGTGALNAIIVTAGATSTAAGTGVPDSGFVNLDLANNSAEAPDGISVFDVRIRQRFNTTYRLEGYSGTASDMPAVISYLGARNSSTTGPETFTADSSTGSPPGSAGFLNVASVLEPPAPLLFAELPAETAASNPVESVHAHSAHPTPSDKIAHRVPSATPGEIEAPAATASNVLTPENLQKLVTEARTRWELTNLTTQQQDALKAIRFEISELAPLHLGLAHGNLIRISRTAAGNSWFIDPTPGDDSEFSTLKSETSHRPCGVDLLTTIMHEMGHILGLPDSYSPGDSNRIMYGFLTSGERRVPAPGEANGATPFQDQTPRFLGAPISIGTLPPGKSVTIVGTVTVDDPATTFLISSQGTVSGANFTNVLTDDTSVTGTTNPTETPVERPDTTVTSLNRSSTSPSNASSVSWDVVFANAVNGLTSSNFSLANTGLGGTPAITGVTASGGAPATTWTITASTGSGSGTLGLNMANDTNLTFDVTNLSFTGQVHTIDRTPPDISSITLSDSALKIGDTSTVTFTFTEAVTGFTNTDLTIANGSLTAVSSSDGGTTWTATLTPSASVTDAVNVITLNKTGVADAVGNAGTGSSDSPIYSIDTVRPTLASTISISDTALKIGDTATVTLVFDEAITGFTTADLSAPSGSLTSLSSGDGGITWTATLTPNAGTEDSSNVITLDYTGITDLAGNAGTGSADSPNYAVDTLRPTAGIVVSDNSLTAGETSLVTITFNEAVTGFTNGDLTIANGTLSAVSSSDGGTTWTATLTPNAVIVATNAITLNNTGVTDAAGNTGTGSTDSNNYAIDISSVSIAATTATAAEGGATGLYTFTRTGSTGDLTVNFQLDAASTATAGTDFDITSSGTLGFNTNTGAGTIVIPNGQTTATATLTAFAETLNEAEAAETAILNVETSSSYAIGAPANATVTITENSFLVSTTANSGNGSLRQALLNANSIAGDDTITFDATTFGSSQTITLASVLPLASNIVLAGPAARLTLSGNNATGVISQSSGTTTISDVTITGGNASGISVSAGTLTVLRCAITSNHAPNGGGGIVNAGTLNVVNSLIANNTDARSIPTGGGAGIFSTGTLAVINSTISGNNSTGTGSSPGAIGILGNTSILNSTITNNGAVTGNGGIRCYSGTVTVTNSIVAGNVDNTSKPDVLGTFTSGGGNLIGNADTSTGFTHGVNSDQVGTGASPINPQLAALANNGGATQTHALLASSPALNAGLDVQLPVDTFDIDGDTNTAEVIDVDQRGTGFTRTIGTVDIGAFELQKSVSIADLTAANEGNSGTTDFIFTITRTGDTTGAVNMTYTVSGAAVNAADFGGSLPTGTATIANGDTTTTVTIPVSGDTTVEPNEAFTVTLSAPDNGYVISGVPATSTINNDDSATVGIAKITDGTEADTPTNGKFRVTQTAASSTDTTVSYTVTGTATSATDFTALSGSVTIPAGQTTADIDVTVLNDGTTLEPTETVIITLDSITAGSSNITVGTTDEATMDITDDDTATVTIAKINDGAETPSNALFRVTQSSTATVNTVLTYTVDGTATSGDDFTAPSGSVTILAGQTTADISVTVADDAIVEATETLSLTLSGITASDADVSLGTTVTDSADLTDNDSATVTIAKITDASEPSTNGLFRVTQSAQSSSNTVVTYAITGTATAGSDYTTLSGSVTIAAGQTTADITVTTSNDSIVENAETVIATLNGFSSRDADITLGSTVSDTVNLADDDSASVTIAKITDGIEAAVPTNAVFRVTQSAASSSDTVLSYTVGGTATSGTDYTTLSGSVTIAAGQTTADISVAVLNENVVEPTETVSLTLTGFTARDPEVTLGASLTAAANITDSDNSVITLSATSADQNEGSGGSTTAFTFTATLSNPVPGGLTIAYNTSNGTASAGSDYTDNDGSLTFAGTAGETQTITVLVAHDDTNEIDETFTVSLGTITGTTLASSLSTAGSPQTGTIRNDDGVTLSIAATDANADENTGDTGTFRITRNGTVGNTTVQLQIDANSDALAADWIPSGATFGSLAPGSTGSAVIPDGQSFVNITLTPKADAHAEAAESVILNISADAAYTVGSPASANVNIAQNDFLVNNTDSYGEGTLMQAIWNANDLAGDDTITFDTTAFASAQTITFIKGGYHISSNVVIQGPGAQLLTLNANTLDSVFTITGGATVRISDLTATNGRSSDAGGGIIIDGGSHVTLLRCAVTNSTSLLNGGGIHVTESTLNVVNSTISGNTATTIGGGAISTDAGMTGAVVNILNSTISGNTGSNGGAFSFAADSTVSIVHSTITNNTSTSGAAVETSGGTTTIANSIIAANVGNTSIPDLSGTFTSGGGNLIGNAGTATGFTHGVYGDRVGTGAAPVNPLLAPLANNGGPTLTHLPLNGSPAINNGLVANLPADTFDLDGDSNTTEVLPVDQRGGLNLRKYGPTPDSGAVEALAFNPTVTNTTTREDTLSSTGLVITANPADGGLTTHYKITAIRNGTLYQNDGTTPIAANSFITKAQGAAGLKFLPRPNAHSGNTTTFGFSVQAAVSATDIGLRGTVQSASIKVLSVNDAPTVVAPGLPDLVTTIGVTRTVILAGRFRDVDGDTLTYTVANNSNPTVASATVSGTSLLLKALASGVARITVRASDGLGGFVSDTMEFKVGTPVASTIQLTTGQIQVNPETGLFDVKVRVKNTTPQPLNGFRLYVDYSKYKDAYPSLRLFNASSPRGSDNVFIDYRKPVAVGGTVTLTLSYYVRGRTFPKNFNPIYRVKGFTTPVKLASPQADPDSCFTSLETTTLPNGDVRVEFPAVNGLWYRVSHSSDETHWVQSPTPVQAHSSTLYWIDRNPPTDGTRRSYQIQKIKAP